MGMKRILCIHDIDINLASNKLHFLFQLDENSGYYGSVKFPLSYNDKIGNCHLLLCYYRYFYKNVPGVVLF